MKCQEIVSRLSAYQDGELDARRTEIVRRHLESCADCREELAAMDRLSDLVVPEMTSEDAPAGFAQSVMGRLPERQCAGHPTLRPFLRLSGIAVLVLLIGLFVRYWVIPSDPVIVQRNEPGAEVVIPLPGDTSPPQTPEKTVVEEPLPVRRETTAPDRRARPKIERAPIVAEENHATTPTDEPESRVDLVELAERHRASSSAVVLSTVPIGDERAPRDTTEDYRAQDNEVRRPDNPSIRVVARPEDGNVSIGISLE